MAEMVPVVFANTDDRRLFGIMHLPDENVRREVGIILLSPGVKMRVAPHRLYNEMAAAFAADGYPVLRFDFWGLGDSEGEIDDRQLADLYGKVQVGFYKSDTITAMDWLTREYRIDRFLLAGLCGGAITGLLAGAEDPRVEGLFGLGIPVILDNANIDARQYMTEGQLQGLRRGYLQRLLRWQSWMRLLTLRTDYGLLWRSLVSAARPASREPVPAPEQNGKLDNFNPLFPEAFFAMAGRGRPICFVFSGADRLCHEYEEKFVARYGEQLKHDELPFETHLIENANHILSAPEHKAEMLCIAQGWLREHFT